MYFETTLIDKQISPEELIALLASPDYQKCNDATKEIFKTGEQIFDLLLEQQGNSKPFSGTLLGDPNSATFTFVEIPGFPLSQSDREKTITVEVASLYLVSAIYHGRLDFAQNALLTDLNLPPAERRARNKSEYIKHGFRAVKKWVERCEKAGLASLKEKGDNPLREANLAWW